MSEFKYIARSQDGKVVKGATNVKNENELVDYLKKQNLTLTSIKNQAKKSKNMLGFIERFQRIPSTQKIFFVNNLEVMMRSGFSIGRALGVLADQTSSKLLKKIVLDIKNNVESGKSFAESLGKYSKLFSELFVNMVAAGEASGQLDAVLKKLAIQLRKDHALIAKVKGALTYPIIVIIAMIGVGIAMMVFVIPQLTTVFTESGVELPLVTRILMDSSSFIITNGLFLAVGLVILIIALMRLFKTKKGKSFLHKAFIKMPLFSPIVKKVNLARFSRSLHSLLKTDIPIVTSFEIISKTLGNVHYRVAIKNTAEKLKTGSSVKSCLEKYPNLFTPVILQMISVGEESGTLDTITEDIASFYEEEVDQTMNNLSTIIEPILMLFLGGGVAAMAAAIILPIYQLSEAV